MSNISVNFYLNPRPTSKGLYLIFLYYSSAGKRRYISTQQSVLPDQWNKDKMRIKPSYAGAVTKNALLDKMRTGVEKIYDIGNISTLAKPEQVKLLIKSLQPRTVLAAKAAELVTEVVITQTFFDWIEAHIKTVQRKKLTKVKYRGTLTYLKNFKAEKWSKRPLDFIDINIEFYNAFYSYLAIDNDLAVNSIGSHIKNVKAWMNESFEQEKHSNLRYKTKSFKVVSETSDTIALTEAEIKVIYDLDLSGNQSLEPVRDMFIIACYTALRYSDYNQVRPENIKNGILKIRSVKTGTNVEIALHGLVKQVLAKYDGVMPHLISNQKFNKHLHDIAKLAGLDEPIPKSLTKESQQEPTIFKKYELVTAHTARRSAATNLFRAGVSPLIIMALTGHRNEKSFMKYIKVTQTEYAQMLLIHFSKLEASAL